MPTVKKYTDWRNYWLGLRTNLIKCIGTTGSSWLGSNGLAATKIPGTESLGLDWRQAIGLFAVHIGIEVFAYMKTSQPQVITETVETTHFAVDKTTGAISGGSSATTTVTPIPEPPNPNEPPK